MLELVNSELHSFKVTIEGDIISHRVIIKLMFILSFVNKLDSLTDSPYNFWFEIRRICGNYCHQNHHLIQTEITTKMLELVKYLPPTENNKNLILFKILKKTKQKKLKNKQLLNTK